MSMLNRLANCHNRYQGDFKKVLCLCSAGLLRSPTIAWVLGQEPYNYNTRAAGVSSEYALIEVDDVLIEWADLIVCAQDRHESVLRKGYDLGTKPVISLNIPDMYPYRDSKLIGIIREKLDEQEVEGET